MNRHGSLVGWVEERNPTLIYRLILANEKNVGLRYALPNLRIGARVIGLLRNLYL
jgi:hypothetical protein